jgi:hypothetical protein
MTHTITCPSCQAALQIRPEYAGRSVHCPRCSATVSVPAAAAAPEAPAAQPAPAEHIEEVRPVSRAAPRQPVVLTAVGEGPAPPRPLPRREEPEDRPRRRASYKPCPRCGKGGAERVLWTPWGSFYGPAMLTHVRCPACGYGYNGRTGHSNALGIFFFTLIPLLLLAAINIGLWLAIARLGQGPMYIVLAVFAFEAVVGLVLLILTLVRSGGHGGGAPRREREGP